MGGGDRLPFCRPGLPQLHSARGGRRSAGHRQRTDGRNKQQQKKIYGLCLLFNISRYLFYFILFYFILFYLDRCLFKSLSAYFQTFGSYFHVALPFHLQCCVHRSMCGVSVEDTDPLYAMTCSFTPHPSHPVPP